jgi:recombination protein RecA
MAKKNEVAAAAVSAYHQARQKAIAAIEKAHGKGAIQQADARPSIVTPAISTGNLALDLALGVLGVPEGRIIEIFGPESSGKTTLATHILAQAQIKYPDRGTALVDAEHAYDLDWGKRIGIKPDRLDISQPDTGEQALEICQTLVESGAYSVIVVDSVAALVPRAEIEGEMGDSHVGLQARLMSQAMRKLTAKVSQTKTTVIFINQIREKIGVMFGNPETTTGGRALKFYSSVRLDIRRTGSAKEGEVVVGSETRVKVVKNKVSPPFREAKFRIYYGDPVSGIDEAGTVLDMAVTDNIIEKSGAWYSYNGTRLGQGQVPVTRFLIENPDILAEVRKRVIAARTTGEVIEAASKPMVASPSSEENDLNLPPPNGEEEDADSVLGDA